MSNDESKQSSASPHLERKSGRPVFDAQGTRWEWQVATGVFSREITREQMDALLEGSGSLLQIVEDAPASNSGCMARPAARGMSPGQRPLHAAKGVKRHDGVGLFGRIRQAFGG